jgi:hypothetical protein
VLRKLVIVYDPAANVNVFSIPADPATHEHPFTPRRANAAPSTADPPILAPVTTTADNGDTPAPRADGEPGDAATAPDADSAEADEPGTAELCATATGTVARGGAPGDGLAADLTGAAATAAAGTAPATSATPQTSTTSRRITPPPHQAQHSRRTTAAAATAGTTTATTRSTDFVNR